MTEPTQPGVPVNLPPDTPPVRAARMLPEDVGAPERPVAPTRAASDDVETSQATPTRPEAAPQWLAGAGHPWPAPAPAGTAGQPPTPPAYPAPHRLPPIDFRPASPGRPASAAPGPPWLTQATTPPQTTWPAPTGLPYQARYPYPLPSTTPGGSYAVNRPHRSGQPLAVALGGIVLLLVLTLIAAVQTGWLHRAYTEREPNAPRPAPTQGPSEPDPTGPIPTYQAQVTPELSAGVVLISGMADYGRSSGSGMVLTEEGLVLTNYHVVADTETLSVEIADTGQSYDAEVLGRNVWADVALLRLQGASGLATVDLSDAAVQMSDELIAVGNADGGGVLLGTGGSVTAINSTIWLESQFGGYGSDPLTGLIESTMGAIPGYSGGPTFNTDGEVIGVTSAGQDEVATEMVTYSIPIDNAMHIVDDILGGRESEQTRIGPGPWLGVGLGEADVPTITGVTPGSPAEAAGLTVGSTITSFNGTAVNRAQLLLKLMESADPGQQVEIVWTDEFGNAREAIVTLGTSPLN